MVSERSFRTAWKLMWHYKHLIDESVADSELLEDAEREYKKCKDTVDRYYDEN